MLNPEQGRITENIDEQKKNLANFENCLPADMKRELKRKVTEMRKLWKGLIPTAYTSFFGSAANRKYGCLCSRAASESYSDEVSGHPYIFTGLALMTPLLNEAEYSSPRAYHQIFLENNEAITASDNPPYYQITRDAQFPVTFSYYPIPGTDDALPLMSIGPLKSLAGQMEQRLTCSGGPDIIRLYVDKKIREEGPDVLAFLHPDCTAAYFDKLVTCLNPLWETLNADTPPPPLAEKVDAMATIYWLVAQSTPVVKGGTGFANVMLEHMAYRLQQQGYEIEIPYFKKGHDLWAEAATQPLESFKVRFKEGLFQDSEKGFFDHQATDELVARELANKSSLQSPGMGR